MRRVLAAALALCLATPAFAQSGLLPANQVWAGPPSGGQGFARARALVPADIPAVPLPALPSGQIWIGSAGNAAVAQTVTGDCTLSLAGVVACPSSVKTGTAAGGDLSGTYPNPGVAKIAGVTPGTGVTTALGVAIGSAGAPVLFNGAGGTPASLAATNATGTAAGLTAGHVTTNANLTGDVTSVGNATTYNNVVPIAKGGTNDTGTAWATYTPTVTSGSGTITTVTSNTSTFKTLGKTVFVTAVINIVTNGTGASSLNFTLPVAAVGAVMLVGRETVSTGIALTCSASSGSTVVCVTATNAYPGVSGGLYNISGVYQST